MKTIMASLFVRILPVVSLSMTLLAGLTANADGAPDRITADPRTRQYVVPARVIWTSPGDTVRNAEVLLQKRSGQATLGVSNPCVLQNKGGPAAILLDFGRELHGGVQVMVWNTKDNKPVRLRVRFGESVSEAMSDIGRKNAVNDHAIRDQTCLVPWLGTHETGNTGFRFVRIDLDDADSMIELKSVRAVFLFRDLEYRGSFKCSDERLNRIWETGAYTVHLNMQDYLWDGIKRDRLVWIGDMHPEAMTIFSAFGCNEIIPASLDLVRDETPLPSWMNGISSYSIWWILIQNSWYMQSGDLAYLKKQQRYLTGLLGQLIKHIDQENRETLTGMRFMDWPSDSNKVAVHAGLQSLMASAMLAGGELCSVLGDEITQKECADALVRLKRHIPAHGNSKQAAAMMALAGLGDPVKLNSEVMAVDGAKRMSTFYGYYVLQAKAMAGDYQGCLDLIRQYWGAMIDLGATTFWEDFDLDWAVNAGRIDEIVPEGKKDIHGDYGSYCYKGFRHSLCHGWASGPTAWLSEHVLGIKVMKPGCKVVRIMPHLGDLEWVEGTYPTPYGIIKVRHVKRQDGTIDTKIDAPKEVQIVREGRNGE